MKTINEQWKDFEANVIAKEGPTPELRKYYKRVFFAGFAAALGTMLGEVADLPEEEGEKALTSYLQQVRGFGEAVKIGGA